MRRTALLVTITLGALTGPLRAQAGPDTTWIARWRDSLAGLDDAALRARLSATPAPTTVEDRLRLGWLLETGGERLDSAPLLTRAADQFYEVTVRQKRWTAGWFGLGTAKAALADLGVREVRSAHQNPGTGWVWGSALAYLQVLAIDSTHGPAAVALARLTPRLDIGSRRSAAANAIGRAVRADSTDPMLWLLSARAARDAGASTAVLTALGHALALPNAPVGGLQFERAWELFTLDQREEAEAAYYLGAGMDDSLGRALYRQDLAYVADSTELRAWDRTAAAARGAWLQAFWERREREAGRPAGSRLREHRRRLRYAREHFAVIPTWSREYNFETINHEEAADLDDRGVIYVRHGEPDVTTGLIGSGGGLPLNASWMYYRTEGNLIFHFIAVRGRWALIPSLAMLSPPDNPSPEVFASRMALDPWYGVIALRLERDSTLRATNLKLGRQVYDPQTGAFDILRLTERDRRARTADIRRGLSTDSDPLHFERAMEPIVQVFGASAETPGQGRLVVALSLPANDRLVPVPLPDGGTGYLLRLRVTSADDSGRTTLDSDTLLRVRTPHPLTRGEHLSVVRSFLLPATGDQRVRLILTDTARAFGAVRIVNGVPLPSTDVERPEMTDLIVGATRSGVAWARPGSVPVPLHPLNAWTTDEAIEINFELTGVAAGARYTVRIGIADLGADSTAPPRASVQFENQASGGREFVSQSLGLRTLRPGRYLLTATVTIGDTVLRREKRINLVRAR